MGPVASTLTTRPPRAVSVTTTESNFTPMTVIVSYIISETNKQHISQINFIKLQKAEIKNVLKQTKAAK
jgi:hypothetical protein